MWGSMGRLTTKYDVLPPLIALVVGVMIALVLRSLLQSPGGKAWVTLLTAAVLVGITMSRGLRVAARYRRLMRGRCATPSCRGVVQRSEKMGRGWVVCPTCKKYWPEMAGMNFRLTART